MVNSYLEDIILQHFPHKPTNDQIAALRILSGFLVSNPDPDTVLLIKGYAGTGKTSLVGALVKTLESMRQKTILLAPTGRAAKVFSLYAGHRAYTIHRKIYRQKSFSNEPAGFVPAGNPHKNTLFIVDEASMIANQATDAYAAFGSGCLLDDLIQYVYSGENCRLILMGDEAQLPPVMLEESPALNPGTLRGYNLQVFEATLTQVVRQNEESDILSNATRLREAIRQRATDLFPKLQLQGGAGVKRIRGDDLADEIATAYARNGIEETMVVVRSNKQANIYNNGIRNRILYREEELSTGDRLMIARNNYYWTAGNEEMDFIANGEIIQVLRVKGTSELYGFRFADVCVRFQDYDTEADIKIVLDSLQSESPALSKEQNDRLFYAVMDDYSHISTKTGRMKKIKADPYYNVVQVKYAYAVTCHKAQGGQWANVFLDIGYVNDEMLGEPFYRWLYTAFTRTTGQLFLVNLSDRFF
ncbi:MAG: AAA family ATPase [Tannerellaceae bacterium]|jgi:exodeoxyribonuclease-5|nr:AAA family ATPase [Tannerellaceae bacterium]